MVRNTAGRPVTDEAGKARVVAVVQNGQGLQQQALRWRHAAATLLITQRVVSLEPLNDGNESFAVHLIVHQYGANVGIHS